VPEAEPEEPDVWTYFDVSEDVASDTLSEVVSDAGDVLSDVDEDADVGPDGDGETADIADIADIADQDLEADAEPEDVADISEDVADDATSGEDAAPEKQLILLKEDTIEEGSGDTYFLLNDGEAWVADLSTPVAGHLKYAEVFLANVSAPDSCGRFRFAVWAPDDNGLLPDAPTYVEPEEHLLPGVADGQTVPLSLDMYLEAGSFRIGVILEGPCTDDDVSPALMSDDSGVVDASWLWIPLDGTPPWVPASVFGVDGRWGIRAILETEQPLEP
jgi:hypothetical protein